ncbi:DUF1366 domain-containing protein [Streptococcus suis]|uniref:Protein of uncharacterized function (DUF1366) n=5 Tax=Streptococcus suis TaxID=1307 RepID=A0A123V2S8_STRSU|nr:DUF1366 domain-containing protein [Streptococcus suis]NQP75316.1 DUF1366 domain-containing protein [Streptococcus suis]NQP77166.1 DUF1366 domain-containing protein [Streptococcus suis]NQP91416.1 DUF1366 domain-containing protein [Streptococcus suis]NQP93525.1 DUF1366 domain-containing protein [Streptococcus suis]NQS64121.1 DUF1366 domain-containing protein [Streptococcus suis]
MRLKFGNKSLEYTQGEHPKTRVLLINDEGAMYPIYFDKEAIDKSDAELFELALEKIYQDNFPNRAEDEKFNEIGKRLAKIDDITDEATKNLEKVKEQVTMSTSSRAAFLQVVMTLYGKGLLTDEDLLQTGLFDDEAVEETLETIKK